MKNTNQFGKQREQLLESRMQCHATGFYQKYIQCAQMGCAYAKLMISIFDLIKISTNNSDTLFMILCGSQSRCFVNKGVG